MGDFLQFSINGVLTGLVYAVVALAFVQVYRASGIFNLAQGGLVMIGGYFVWTFAEGLGLNPWLGLVLALAVAFGLGAVVERAILRPLVGQPVFSMVMVTIGLLVLLQGIVVFAWGGAVRPFPWLLSGPPVVIGPLQFTRALFIGGLTALAVTVVLWQVFERTVFGLRLTAVAEGHVIAQSLGISPQQAIAISWGIAAALSAWAAVLLMDGRSLNLHVADIGMKAMVIPILSGLESVPGVIVGGIIVGVGEALASAYLDPLTGGAISSIFSYLLMLAVLLIRPQGIFGWRIIERV